MYMKRVLIALVASLSLVACATNPATGRTELNFYSEEEEINLGRQANDEILREFYVYDEKPELNELVDTIGRRIADQSPRPNLPWTFTLLDTPMVNAMALPGGYVYVTRGILERMNSEDELAGVIGHEVAHVAARHSTHSMSTASMAQIGVIAAAAILTEGRNFDEWATLGLLGAGLLFTKYNRQQETEADLLGTKYMASTGYNPIGSENMLQGLKRLGGTPNFLERYFMDHPDPAKRVDDVRRQIATLQTADKTILERDMKRDAFIRALDGMVTGNGNSATTIRNGVVYNRTFNLVVHAPRGWRPVIESGSLFAMYRGEGEEVVYAQELTKEDLEEHKSPRAAVRAQLEELGMSHVEQFNRRIGSGETLTVDLWEGKDEDGSEYEVESTQHRSGDGALVFLHIAKAGDHDRASLLDMLDDMSIDPDEVRKIKQPRLRVMQARSGDTWQSLARRATGKEEHASEIAAINGFDFPSDVPAGMMVKLPDEVAVPVE
jgi:predicted Zn-dependent protease